MNFLVVAILIGVIVLVVLAVEAGMSARRQRRRTHELQLTFGSEYGRAVQEFGDLKAAEQKLEQRMARVGAYDLEPLDDRDRRRFVDQWQAIRVAFVEDPALAVSRADDVLVELMHARGYEGVTEGPVHRAADISVGFSEAAESYRTASAVLRKDREGEATTDDLRAALRNFGMVFEQLLGSPGSEETVPDTRPEGESHRQETFQSRAR